MNAAEIMANASEAGGSSPLPTEPAQTGENSSKAGPGGSFAEALVTQTGNSAAPMVSGSVPRDPQQPKQLGQDPEMAEPELVDLVEDDSVGVLPAENVVSENSPSEVLQNATDTLADALSLRLGVHGAPTHGGDRPIEGESAFHPVPPSLGTSEITPDGQTGPERAVVPDQSAETANSSAGGASEAPLSAHQESALAEGVYRHVPQGLPGAVFATAETASHDGASRPGVAVASAAALPSVADGPPARPADSAPVGDANLDTTQLTESGDKVQRQAPGLTVEPLLGDHPSLNETSTTANTTNTADTTNTTAASHPDRQAVAIESRVPGAPAPSLLPKGGDTVADRSLPADVSPSTPENGDVAPEAVVNTTRRAAVPYLSSDPEGQTGRVVSAGIALTSAPEQIVAGPEGSKSQSTSLARLLGLGATLGKGDVTVSGGSGPLQTLPLLLELPGPDGAPQGARFPFALPEAGGNPGELLAMAFGAQRADAQRFAEIARLLEQGEHAAESGGARSSSVSGATVTSVEAIPEWTGATMRSATPQTQLSDLEQLELPDQLIRAIRMQWRNGLGEAKLRLTPEHLGEVMVALQVRQGSVSAVLRADTELVRDWIRTHQNELKSLLESQGLRLESLVVEEDGHSDSRPDQQFARDRRPTARPTSGEARFEVRV